MFVYIRSAAFVIVVTQKLVLQQSKNVTAVYGNPIAPSFYSISPWIHVLSLLYTLSALSLISLNSFSVLSLIPSILQSLSVLYLIPSIRLIRPISFFLKHLFRHVSYLVLIRPVSYFNLYFFFVS